MPDGLFTSYAQNAEDVVLRRAFGHLPSGRYIDVGAHHPVVHSVTKQLYEAGWSGLNLEPVQELYDELARDRPRDVNLQVAAGAERGTLNFHVVRDTGLSTLRADVAAQHAGDGRQVDTIDVEVVTLDDLIAEHLAEAQIHLLKIDVEGAEEAVLAGLDLSKNRPWVLLVEATEPLSVVPTHQAWEPGLLAADYEFCLFDGLSRWYVAAEHAAALRPALSYPACVLDDWVPVGQVRAVARADRLAAETELWRSEVLRHVVRSTAIVDEMHERVPQFEELRWRVEVLNAELADLQPRLDEAIWQRGLLTEERDWLRGLLAEEKQRADLAIEREQVRLRTHPTRLVARKVASKVARSIAARRQRGQDDG